MAICGAVVVPDVDSVALWLLCWMMQAYNCNNPNAKQT
jgi:hypothetical protein